MQSSAPQLASRVSAALAARTAASQHVRSLGAAPGSFVPSAHLTDPKGLRTPVRILLVFHLKLCLCWQ